MTLKQKINQIRGLKPYKGKSPDELKEIAKNLLSEEKKAFSLEGNWINKTEKNKAEALFNNYIEEFHFDNSSQIELLKKLVFEEIYANRIEVEIKKRFDDKDQEYPVNKTLTDSYNNIVDKILYIKKQLGMVEEKNKTNPLEYIQRLFKKFKVWKENNVEGRGVTCCWCKKKFFLNIRTDKYEAQKHPYFTGRILNNPVLWKIYKEGRITKEELANALETSTFYIDFIDEKRYNKPSQENT